MLYIDIAKVDRDVAHFVMAIHVCFKCMFQMFQLFQMNVASVFIWMLHIHARSKHMFQVFSGVSYVCLRVFHLDVAYVSHICCKSMFEMFQLFQSYVAISVFMLQVASVLS